jgi:hypothetical protein
MRTAGGRVERRGIELMGELPLLPRSKPVHSAVAVFAKVATSLPKLDRSDE